MRLSKPFIRLPWTFDANRLADEIQAIDSSAWMSHPSRLEGNTAAALISRGGLDNDDFDGAMAATPHLRKCPYLAQVLASFDQVLGRSRLMKLAAGADVAQHVDFNYHWVSRVRIHIPIITNDRVIFYCGPENVHMRAGESWIFDSWRRHRVTNDSEEDRVHLVVDTGGSSAFWKVVRRIAQMSEQERESSSTAVAYDKNATVELRTEQFNIAAVMAPGEMLALAKELIEDFSANSDNDPQFIQEYRELLLDLCADWREVWAEHGEAPSGRARYQSLLEDARKKLHANPRALLTSSNKIGVNPVIVQRILRAALAAQSPQ